jgi:hypothetical protein
MSDSTKRPAAPDPSPSPPFLPISPSAHSAAAPGLESKGQQSNHAERSASEGTGLGEDLTVALKRHLEASRLPADLKAQILAELPPPEEREQLLRELQAQGGLSSEQFLASLELEVEPQP